MAVISATPPPPITAVVGFAEPPPRRALDVQTQRPTEDSRETGNEKDQDVVIIERRERQQARQADDDEIREVREEGRRLDIRV